MEGAYPRGGMWPTASDLLLLRTLVMPPADSAKQWDRLRSVYPSGMDVVTQQPRLAPLFHYRCREAGIEWPAMGPLAETARRVWGSNQMRIFRSLEIATTLDDAGIDAIFLKGVALLPRYPADNTRPMHDLDVLVRRTDFDRAMKVLSGVGWRADFDDQPLTRRFDHAGLLVREDGQELDLHWRLAPGSFADDAIQNPWDTSQVVSLAGRPLRVLGPTYQLYHTISHGLAWDKNPSLHWVPDAAFTIEATGAEIDWDGLLALADTNRRGVVVRDGLALLARGIGVEIPERALQPSAHPSGPERREAWFLRHIGPKSLVGGVPDRWYLYRRVSASIGEAATPWGYWRYLRWRWRPHGSIGSTVRTKLADRITVARRQRRGHQES